MITNFGFMPDGKEVFLVELRNEYFKAKLISYGATLNSFETLDAKGNLLDIVLGFDNLEDYILQDKCFGCIVGRCTNRISNASFKLNGETYHLYKNNAGNSSHGGKVGFGKKAWDIKEHTEDSVTFHITSPDMDENYPGELNLDVKYSLTDTGLKLEYLGHSTKDTIVNLTNHAYFNLNGHAAGTIEKHLLTINADNFVWANEKTIPDGKILPVANTDMDFREPKEIGKVLNSDYDQIKWAKGLDRNWCINGNLHELNKACVLESKESGIKLTISTTQPGLQVYTGNYLSGSRPAKENVNYIDRAGVALECQGYPDAINHENFPSVVLRAGEEYRECTYYDMQIIRKNY